LATCDTGPDGELAGTADILVVSNEFLHREFPDAVAHGAAREALFARYLQACPGLVVFTSGSGQILFGRKSSGQNTVEPFRVEVVDSAGAGDSFRGGLSWAILQEMSDRDAVRFASAVAALVCTTTPGCLHPPTLEQVEELVRSPA
ncbi:MAG: hypothetical protein RL173_3027, partial [Fibrobacterota bacterium]